MTRIMDRRMLVFALAVLALVLAMTSAAWAAGRNSVDSKAIANGQVKTADLAKGAVTSGKLRDNTVRGIDLKDNAVGTKDLADGGVQSTDIADNGVQSADIADGGVKTSDIAESAVGARELGTILTVVSTTGPITDGDGVTNGGDVGFGATIADCPVSARVIGGGAEWVEASSGSITKNVYVHSSFQSGNGWFARGIVDFGAQGNIKLRVYAHCLLLGGPQN